MGNTQEVMGVKVVSDVNGALTGLTKVNSVLTRIDATGKKVVTTTGMMKNRFVEFTATINKAGTSVGLAGKELQQFNQGLFKTGDSFGKIILKVAQWTVATGLLFGSIRALKGGLDTITDIDDKMVMLTKVFQGTEQQLARVREEAMKVSVSMGNLTGASIDATTEWAKMGRVGSELSEGLRVSLLGQNIAEIEAADGAKFLNAAMLQFGISMDGAIGILDEWNALSNQTSVTTRDLAASTQQAGAIFRSAGASIQDLNAYTAALSSSMAKSGKEIGSALKTIGSYIRRQSSIPKILSIAGVAIERQGGQLMELDQIVLELAGRWQTLTDIQKEEIAQTAAGVRRKAFFLNLMDNFNLVLENYAIQWQAAGSAMQENEIRMKSLKTKMLQLSAAVEKMAIKTGDKGLLKIMKDLVDWTRKNVDNLGDLEGGAQLAELAIAGLGAQFAVMIIRTKALTVAMASLGTMIAGTISFFTKFAGLVGLVITLGYAIDSLVSMMLAEEIALRNLNDERERRIATLKGEIAALRSSKQQYQIFKSLVDQFEKLRKNNESTDSVMEHITQVWNSINDINPGLLIGLTTMHQVLLKLQGAALGAGEKIEDLMGEVAENEIKVKVSILLNESSFKDDLDEYIEGFQSTFENTTREIAMEGTMRSKTITTSKRVPNELVDKAREGDVDSAIELLEKFRKFSVKDKHVFSTDMLEYDRPIGEAIKSLEEFKGSTIELKELLKNTFGPEFDSGAWDKLNAMLDKATKRGVALDERLDKILGKDKTAATLFEEAGFSGDIKSKTFETRDDRIAIEAEIEGLKAIGKLDDESVDVIRTKGIEREKILEDYKVLLEIFYKLTEEQRKQATADKRDTDAAQRIIDAAKKALVRKQKRLIEAEARRIAGFKNAIGSDLGDVIGTAVFHGLTGEKTMDAAHNFAESIGALLSHNVETAVTGALTAGGSALAGPLGALAGSLTGSLIGGLADLLFGEDTQAEDLAEEMDRNTLALEENTNAFQDFQERLINAPSTFALPALSGESTSGYTAPSVSSGGGGGGTTNNSIDGMTISISGAGNPEATGKAVVAAIDKAYASSDDRGKNLTQDF